MSSRRSRDGFLYRDYGTDEVDAIAAYCDALDRCFYLRLDELKGRSKLHLRLAASRNRQELGINRADDFDFGATLGPLVGP